MIFFLRARSRSSSRATFLRARKVAAGSRVFLTGRTASSSCSPPLVAGAAVVPAQRMRPAQVPGSSSCSARTLPFHGSDRLRMAAMDHIWREESPDRVGDRETRVIGLLSSRARLGIYFKFALSFAKLPKMQTPNAKPLDTSFYDFWQITRMQSPNVKPLEML